MMSFTHLILQSFRFYWRSHLAALIGAAIATGVLTGALFAGDSVKESLRNLALRRLGDVHFAANGGERFFADSLAQRMSQYLPVAAIVDVAGMAKRAAGTKEGPQLNQVHVLGVDAEFWRFSKGAPVALGPDEVAINETVAQALRVRVGADLAVRVVKPSLMPRDAPLSQEDDESFVRLLAKVKAVVPDDGLGRFSLAADQSAPYNIFVDRAWLQQWIGMAGRANLLLAGPGNPEGAVKCVWSFEDVGLRLRQHPSGIMQLESERIFIESAVAEAVRALPFNRSKVLSYLVNSISKDGKMTPYSFAVGGGSDWGLKEDDAAINRWTADRLGAEVGDKISVKYYVLSPANEYVEREHAFVVRKIVEMDDLASERDLMSVFPGLTDVERCADWKIGMPMDEAMLSDPANEAYWKQYGPTPKLLISLETAQGLWENRFGPLTAIRFDLKEKDADNIARMVQNAIQPAMVGLAFSPARQQALTAAAQSIDFGGLFLGMSFFLIISALLLAALLFVFGIEQRAAEMGVLLAVGFRTTLVRRLVTTEAVGVALAGSLIGALSAVVYTRVLLFGLSHPWRAAVAGTAIEFHASLRSMLIGPVAGAVCAVLAMVWAVRHQTRRSAVALLHEDPSSLPPPAKKRRHPWGLWLGLAGMGCAAASAIPLALGHAENVTEAFFGIGSLFLLSALSAFGGLLRRVSDREKDAVLSLPGLALRNVARRRGRSLSVAALIACGCFMVFAVSSMQEDLSKHAGERSSGTGGFELYAESTIPLRENPAAALGMPGVDIVPLRLHAGDEASCLNLNRAVEPPLLGVDPRRLASLGAFAPAGRAWDLFGPLLLRVGIKTVEGIVGDANTAMWALGKKTGEMIPYRREIDLAPCQVSLAGNLPMRLSVFQGRILISEEEFTRWFPSESGYRVFLIDTPEGQADAVARELTKKYERYGMDVVPAVDRLYRFYGVEQAYLAMFLALGVMALILGGAGAAVVVLRNLFERRAEHALLRAVGYPSATLFKVLLIEQVGLVGVGFAMGGIASLLAMAPALGSATGHVSAFFQACVMLLTAAALLGAVIVALAVGFERRGFAALRNE